MSWFGNSADSDLEPAKVSKKQHENYKEHEKSMQLGDGAIIGFKTFRVQSSSTLEHLQVDYNSIITIRLNTISRVYSPRENTNGFWVLTCSGTTLGYANEKECKNQYDKLRMQMNNSSKGNNLISNTFE